MRLSVVSCFLSVSLLFSSPGLAAQPLQWNPDGLFDFDRSCQTMLLSFSGTGSFYAKHYPQMPPLELARRIDTALGTIAQGLRYIDEQLGLPKAQRAQQDERFFLVRWFSADPVETALVRERETLAASQTVLEKVKELCSWHGRLFQAASGKQIDPVVFMWIGARLDQFALKVLLSCDPGERKEPSGPVNFGAISEKLDSFRRVLGQLEVYDTDPQSFAGGNPQFDNLLRAAARAKIRVAGEWAEAKAGRDDIDGKHLKSLLNISAVFGVPMARVMGRFTQIDALANDKIDGGIYDPAVVLLTRLTFLIPGLSIPELVERYKAIVGAIDAHALVATPALAQAHEGAEENFEYQDEDLAVLTIVSYLHRLAPQELVESLGAAEATLRANSETFFASPTTLIALVVGNLALGGSRMEELTKTYMQIWEYGKEEQTIISEFHINDLASAKLALLSLQQVHDTPKRAAEDFLNLAKTLRDAGFEQDSDERLVSYLALAYQFGLSPSEMGQRLIGDRQAGRLPKSPRRALSVLALATEGKLDNWTDGRLRSLRRLPHLAVLPLIDELMETDETSEASSSEPASSAARTFWGSTSADEHSQRSREDGPGVSFNFDPDEGLKSHVDVGGGVFFDTSDGSVGISVGGIRFDSDGDGVSLKLF